ncbi:hypothetical protein ACFBZI_05875 [Moraxella sp. ZJ142]|uniref:hypothetical protein n=1 Tax=Moraxella marmotae TaxID=3344520 RepID=UPI0035D3F75E
MKKILSTIALSVLAGSAWADDATVSTAIWSVGSAKTNYQRGVDYYFGKNGVKQDYAVARQWWEKSASQGNVKAQAMLSAIDDGENIRPNATNDKLWHRTTCDNGNQASCHSYQKLKRLEQQNH